MKGNQKESSAACKLTQLLVDHINKSSSFPERITISTIDFESIKREHPESVGMGPPFTSIWGILTDVDIDCIMTVS